MDKLYDFLEKNEKLKVKILTFLESNSNQYFPMATLMDKLELSKFKLVNYVNDINNDLKNLTGFSKVKLEIVNSNFLRAKHLSSLIVGSLRRAYLEKSNHFLYFQSLMYKNISIYDFSEKQFVSESKAYAIQRELLGIIKHYRLTIKNGQLVGDEKDIRVTYFILHFFFFNGIKYPFSENNIGEDVYNQIYETFHLNLSPTQAVKLRLFIAITCLRMLGHNNVLLDENDEQELLNSEETQLYTVLSEHFKASKQALVAESKYLLVFLVAENYINIDDSYYDKLKNGRVERMSQQFITLFCKMLKVNFSGCSKSVETSLDALKSEINRIHFKLLNFNLYTDVFSVKVKGTYFAEVYPEYYEVIEKFLSSYIDREDMIVNRKGLFFDYMLAILATVPTKMLQQKIHICVDFSRGSVYSDYIAQNIHQFQSMNIAIDKFPTSETDIYISDFELVNVACEQLIWKEPPAIKDWRNLGNLLVKVRERKTHEK